MYKKLAGAQIKPLIQPSSHEYFYYLENKDTHDFNKLVGIAVPKK